MKKLLHWRNLQQKFQPEFPRRCAPGKAGFIALISDLKRHLGQA